MSEQAKILAKLHELIMIILKNATATVEEGKKIDELEALLHEQKCYKEIDHVEYSYQGEEIAGLLFSGDKTQAISRMIECEITADDFFGFIEYHDEDEHFADMFTEAFIQDITKAYQLQYQSK